MDYNGIQHRTNRHLDGGAARAHAGDTGVHRSREAALSSLAFEPTVRNLSVVEDLFDALLDVNSRYLESEFVAAMKKKAGRGRVALVEPAPDNPMRPDAPPPENPPVLDIVSGTYWGAESGNLADAD